MSSHAEKLRNIKRFDQLVAYLRDELDWPIEKEDFEDLTFDWDADELGVDLKTAAKIQTMEWGIFFVKFEPKRVTGCRIAQSAQQAGDQETPNCSIGGCCKLAIE
jgi:hypothetical protein